MSNRNLTSLAAEFFVGAELMRQGHVVTITFGNEKAIDLLVCNKDNPAVTRSIDVKGLRGRNPWALGAFHQDRLPSVYVFCFLNNPGVQPRYFIVPTPRVQELAQPAKNGKSYWTAFDNVLEYENQWDLIWQ